jgi:hypothetical protein
LGAWGDNGGGCGGDSFSTSPLTSQPGDPTEPLADTVTPTPASDTAQEAAMTESAASKLTTLCTAVAALGALVGLMVNSGNPPAAANPATTAAAVVVQVAN